MRKRQGRKVLAPEPEPLPAEPLPPESLPAPMPAEQAQPEPVNDATMAVQPAAVVLVADVPAAVVDAEIAPQTEALEAIIAPAAPAPVAVDQ